MFYAAEYLSYADTKERKSQDLCEVNTYIIFKSNNWTISDVLNINLLL